MILSNRNVALLVACQCLGFSVMPMVMLIGSLIGAEFTDDPKHATLPIAATVVGTALAMAPAVMAMRRFGRKPVIIFAMALACLDLLLLSYALEIRSFVLLCVGTAGLGMVISVVNQFRFMAMEAVPAEKATAAASMVLLGGVVAANLGPQMAVWGRYLTGIEYQGAFLMGIVCFVLVAVLVSQVDASALAAPSKTSQGRPLTAIMQSPTFWLAVVAGTIAYAVMTFVMTATPISMHHHHGHSLEATKWVIQSHITAMFLPSLIAPFIAARLGLKGMVVAGCVIYMACIAIGFSDQSVWGFWASLVLLGVGWNFLFVAGTSLLPQSYREGEQFKAQAFNEVVVYTTQAIASLSSGFVLAVFGWQKLLWFCVPVGLIPVLLLVVMRFWPTNESAEPAA